jgi:hypothetical protein
MISRSVFSRCAFRVSCLALLALVARCSQSTEEARQPAPEAGAPTGPEGGVDAGGPDGSDGGRFDTDGDGLCDDTEQAAGTDPESADSDQDGIPDMNEHRSGFDPLDEASPGTARLAVLQEQTGSSVQLLVEVWVQGQGESFTGELEAQSAPAARGLTAADLGAYVEAVAAEPPDHAFDLQPEAARFGAVQGETRLTFTIGFTFTDQPAAGCTRGLAFEFSVKRQDSDQPVGRRHYLLVLEPVPDGSDEPGWCVPASCY